MTEQASGADLARMALAAARKNAKQAPTQQPKKVRRTRPSRGQGRDPQGLATILGKLTAEQGWDTALDGGNLIDQWPTIAPTELATNVRPVAYDPERGILDVQPSSPAYATQVRLFQQQLAKHLNGKLGRPAVRTIRVRTPSHIPAAATPSPEPETPTVPAGPVKTRETAHPGYQAARALALEHRREHPTTNPYLAEARARQEQALRANRQREDEHRDAAWETDRLLEDRVDPAEQIRRAALARARQQKASGNVLRRLFGAA
ncbi:DUF721 domain-containing protein [Streptomyces cellulosae]